MDAEGWEQRINETISAAAELLGQSIGVPIHGADVCAVLKPQIHQIAVDIAAIDPNH